jgi:hypothetical protein
MVNVITDVSKDHIAFIFREKYFNERYEERNLFRLLDPEDDGTTILRTSVSIRS